VHGNFHLHGDIAGTSVVYLQIVPVPQITVTRRMPSQSSTTILNNYNNNKYKYKLPSLDQRNDNCK
jgi:hypothetical protein